MTLTEADVLAEIRRILRDELDVDRPIAPEDGLAAGLDSLSLTVLAVGLEDRFRVRLTPEDAQLSTVSDLAQVIVARATRESAS
ncbi:MAG: acyl carrier protein [Polyangiales bacterium]